MRSATLEGKLLLGSILGYSRKDFFVEFVIYLLRTSPHMKIQKFFGTENKFNRIMIGCTLNIITNGESAALELRNTHTIGSNIMKPQNKRNISPLHQNLHIFSFHFLIRHHLKFSNQQWKHFFFDFCFVFELKNDFFSEIILNKIIKTP